MAKSAVAQLATNEPHLTREQIAALLHFPIEKVGIALAAAGH